MNTKASCAEHHDESLARLRDILAEHSTIWPVLRKVSSSGMMRHLSFLTVYKGEIRDISWDIANVLDYAVTDDNALKVSGAGMDMGFHVVYSLARVLFDDGYALESRWI